MQALPLHQLAKKESGAGRPVDMPVQGPSPEDVTAFFRDLLTERIDSGMKATDIGKAGGVSSTVLSDFKNENRGLGWATMIGLLNAFSITFAQLDSALKRWRHGVRPASKCLGEAPGLQSNQIRAFDFARQCGFSEGAIAYALGSSLLSGSAPADAWYERVRQFQEEINKGLIPAEPPTAPPVTGGVLQPGSLRARKK